jgi:hypothetical protein
MTESEFRNHVIDIWHRFEDIDPVWRMDILARILAAEMSGAIPSPKFATFLASHNAAVLQYISYLGLPRQEDTIN